MADGKDLIDNLRREVLEELKAIDRRIEAVAS
jgi:hypothetical protein